MITSAYVMDSGRHVVETHTDHLGQQYTQTFFAPNDWTAEQIQTRVNEHGAQLEVSLAEGEFEQVIA